MRGLIRLSMVWLLAVLFAASGVAAHLCLAAHHASGPVAAQVPAAEHAHPAHDASDHDHADHDHGAAEHDHADQDDGAYVKCCGVCTIVTGVVPGVEQALFIVSPAVFVSTPDRCSDSISRVDPGIPKRIV